MHLVPSVVLDLVLGRLLRRTQNPMADGKYRNQPLAHNLVCQFVSLLITFSSPPPVPNQVSAIVRCAGPGPRPAQAAVLALRSEYEASN
jgi:hypothetical protein